MRAHHGRERKRYNQRKCDDDTHHPSQLFKHYPSESTHHGHRQEHATMVSVGAITDRRSRFRRQLPVGPATPFDMRSDIFEYHDRVSTTIPMVIESADSDIILMVFPVRNR